MQPLVLTLCLMGAAALIAVPLGIGLATALAGCGGGRLGATVRRIAITMLFVLIALPLYVHAAAWEATAGKFGWLPLMQTSGNRFWFGGFPATAWIHGISGSAWVSLAILWAWQRLPRSLSDQGRMDLTPFRQWWVIALPAAAPAIATAGLWVMLIAGTEMTVADLYGVRTLADTIYLQYAFDPHWKPILQACVTPLLVGIPILWLIDRKLALPARPTLGTTPWWSDDVSAGQSTRWPITTRISASLALAGLLLFLVAIPLISLLVKGGIVVRAADASVPTVPSGRYAWSWERFGITMSDAFSTFSAEYQWTFVIGIAVAVTATPLALIAAWWANGSQFRSRIGAGIALVLMLLPGPVVGMAVIFLFHNRGEWLDSLYQRSIVPTVIACLPRSLPATYFVLRVGYRMLDCKPTEAARSEGGTSWQIFSRIELPRLFPVIFIAALVAATVATADVPSTLVILPPGMTTVGTRTFALLHSGVRYQVAGLTLGFLIFVALFAILCPLLYKRVWRNRVR